MRRLLTLITFVALAMSGLFAQAPNLINYQAVARDGNGDIMANQTINVGFVIHSGSAGGTVVFEETHNSTSTNDFGLFSLQIGAGTNVSGSIGGIDWGADSYWLEVEVNGASIGAQELASVPFALESAGPWTRSSGELSFMNNVGIGVANPGYRLHVETSSAAIAQFDGGNSAYIRISESGTNRAYMGSYSGNPEDADFGTTLGSTGSTHLVTSATPRLTINASGNVGIGTSAPSADLHIKQSSGSPIGTAGIRHEYSGSSDYWQTGIASTDNYWMVFNGSLASFVTTAGIFTTSDARLKTDVSELPDVLEKVGQIKPLTYRYINGSINEPTIGVFAQELQGIYPELVSDEEGTLGVNYPALSVVAIKAIQEQQAQMESMQAEIESLRQELEDLKK